MKRRIITQSDENKKPTIAEKMREDIQSQYKQELEQQFEEERERYREKLEEEKKALEAEYEAKREQLEKDIKKQAMESRIKMNKKIKEGRKKLEEEKNEFDRQKETAKEEIKRKEKELDEWVNSEREKNIQMNEKIKEETEEAIKRKNIEIEKINEIIQEKNNNEAEVQRLSEKVKMLEQIIKEREQKREEERISSIFDISETGAWHEIGYLILEENKDKDSLEFHKDKLSPYYTKDKIYLDGIVIEKGKKTSLIAVPEIVEKNGLNISLIKFYSDSRVVPIYNLLGVLNFMLHIHQIGFKIKDKKQLKEINIKCLVYSGEKCTNSELFQEDKIGTYLLIYKDNKYTNIGILAQTLYEKIKCSKKGIPNEVITRTENIALQKSMQIEGKGKYVDSIQSLSEQDDEALR